MHNSEYADVKLKEGKDGKMKWKGEVDMEEVEDALEESPGNSPDCEDVVGVDVYV